MGNINDNDQDFCNFWNIYNKMINKLFSVIQMEEISKHFSVIYGKYKLQNDQYFVLSVLKNKYIIKWSNNVFTVIYGKYLLSIIYYASDLLWQISSIFYSNLWEIYMTNWSSKNLFSVIHVKFERQNINYFFKYIWWSSIFFCCS